MSELKNIDKDKYKYVFVCGMPRSGTSVLYRNIARFENCTGFQDMPATLPNEGQFIQDVYPTGRELGGPGWFGFDRRSRHTEDSPLLTPENVTRLRASWHEHWDKTKTICVEKTPPNLLMSRFLQVAFPNSYFIVIKRHPIAVSLATQAMIQRMATARPASLHRLFEHWLLCHGTFDGDKKHLHRVYELSYEDYIANPPRYHQQIAAFIGTRVPEGVTEEVKPTQSNRYFDRWRQLLTNSRFKFYYRHIARKYEQSFLSYGYSLTDFEPDLKALGAKPGTSTIAGALSCAAADSLAFARYAASCPALVLKQQAKARLPQSVVARIKAARQRKSTRKPYARALAP